jgi:hypothetical protein
LATITELNGHRMLSVGEGEAALATVRDFTDLIGDAMSEAVSFLAISADRIGDDFYRLRSGLAGEVLQKLVNYHFKLAIIGDVSKWVAESNAFRDLLIELERGTDVFVVPDLPALELRISRLPVG